MIEFNTYWNVLEILNSAVGGEKCSVSNLLRGFSDWLLSPVVVVSIKGDFLTSFLLLRSCKQQHSTPAITCLDNLNAITITPAN